MTGTLIQAAETLADTLAQENAALAAMDLAGAAAMLEAKRAAAAAFDAAQAQPFPPADAALRVAIRLRDTAEENRLLLERALRVQGRIVALLARAARPRPPVTRYGARGALAHAPSAPAIVSARV